MDYRLQHYGYYLRRTFLEGITDKHLRWTSSRRLRIPVRGGHTSRKLRMGNYGGQPRRLRTGICDTPLPESLDSS